MQIHDYMAIVIQILQETKQCRSRFQVMYTSLQEESSYAYQRDNKRSYNQ